MTKQAAIRALRMTHDALKEHPFRNSFNARYISSYKKLLYQLSENWIDIIYHCEETDKQEQQRLLQFGAWVHDYRQNLREYDKDRFPTRLFEYYESMLQVTHNYIDHEDLSIYFNLDCFKKNGAEYIAAEKYQYITKEMCGIDSPVLPRYFPVGRKLCVHDQIIKEYINTSMATKYKSDDVKETYFNDWKTNEKPILVWINETLVKKDDYTHAVWKSI